MFERHEALVGPEQEKMRDSQAEVLQQSHADADPGKLQWGSGDVLEPDPRPGPNKG